MADLVDKFNRFDSGVRRGSSSHLRNGQRTKRTSCFTRCWRRCSRWMLRRRRGLPRVVTLGQPQAQFPANVIRNQKYSALAFPFLVLFEQFRLFLNFCFLVMSLSQFVPALKIGYLYTYWGPLCFVIFVTMVREAVDDLRRWRRDREINSAQYSLLSNNGYRRVASNRLRVGDIVRLDKDERVPADMVLLRTSDSEGTCYLRTDQLDGETDWKLRVALRCTQLLESDESLLEMGATVYAERPCQRLDSFEGTVTVRQTDGRPERVPLSVENTLWASTVLAAGSAVGVVVYTGRETRAVVNNSKPRTKFALIDKEVNNATKVLVSMALLLAFALVAIKGFGGQWYKYLWRFILLFSYIIPLALRMNLDMAKVVYSVNITRDKHLQGCIVRNTTVPEELGRISYLLSDKTGTLTENEMVFKKLHVGTVSFTDECESLAEIRQSVASAGKLSCQSVTKEGADAGSRAADAVKALAVCHNVTPVKDGDAVYQASSPDEVALVTWAANVGLRLHSRNQRSIGLLDACGTVRQFTVLHLFPFSSEAKRMGVIVREEATGCIVYYTKGADTAIGPLVQPVDWADEVVENLAREGLRTLLVARRLLSPEFYHDWSDKYRQAEVATQRRVEKVAQVRALLDSGLELLCVTGVEDRLQQGVRTALETLRDAGVRVWMLTGDKMETACCIGRSARLLDKSHGLHEFRPASLGSADLDQEMRALSLRVDSGYGLAISGECLHAAVQQDEKRFVRLACKASAVLVCRCSPAQKAQVVRLLQRHTGRRCAAVGDGGNDVEMLQAADCGLGIVGKEGRQASLAADVSIASFQQVTRLLLVHGRRCYKNSAALSQFIVHRGLAISTMQAAFSAVFFYAAVSLFPGALMVGYATLFTMFPVFSLVLDADLSDTTAEKFPQLYRELLKGRELSSKSFFVWTAVSIYQGGIVMYGSLWLFEASFVHVMSIAFTSLVFTELLMVALTVRTWHWLMVMAELLSLGCYLLAIVMMPEYFEPDFILTSNFMWKVAVITGISAIPFFILKFLRHRMRPPIARKLQATEEPAWFESGGFLRRRQPVEARPLLMSMVDSADCDSQPGSPTTVGMPMAVLQTRT